MSNFTLCKVASSFDFGFGTHKELREGVEAFYKDPTNLTVPIEVALPRVRDALAYPRGAINIAESMPNCRKTVALHWIA